MFPSVKETVTETAQSNKFLLKSGNPNDSSLKDLYNNSIQNKKLNMLKYPL